MKVDNHQFKGRRIVFLVWRLTTLIFIHYMNVEDRKLNGFVKNNFVEKIVAFGILKVKFTLFHHIHHHHIEEYGWQVHYQIIENYWYDIFK
jgi:hypothetical protein